MRLGAPLRNSRSPDDGLIPMINIVFLLLVFFMVAGSIRPADPIEVIPPNSVRPAERQTAPHVLHLGADGALALDGKIVALAGLADALPPAPVRSVALDVIEGVKSTSGSTETTPGQVRLHEPIALHADARLPFALLRETLDTLRDAGIEQVELLSEPVPTGER